MVVRPKSVSMTKHGHSAARGREKSTGTFISFMPPASESKSSAPKQRTCCTQCCFGDPPSAFAPHVPIPGVQPASQRDRGKAHAAPPLTPARAEHLQETRDAPGLDAGSSPCAKGSQMQAQLEGFRQQSRIDSSLPPPQSSMSHSPIQPGRATEVEPSPLPAPPHISSPGQDRHRLPVPAEGRRAALAAKSSANPDLFEGLGSRRAEPSGKVQAISGHYFPAL